ncbi:hypothetical protein [Microbulbifer spongiae]|uniref:TonB-dependent receptor n=1 Tax=Microbulbifer spongiae TaxID=2944933 RepID=A0ABY9E882_9GAMM|nr:hypothetical protein [Microbulbifer sp. MI-G]WKD49213.1 hypothetical protein M8T91_15115 [Microbulbifer sp. MI-G]
MFRNSLILILSLSLPLFAQDKQDAEKASDNTVVQQKTEVEKNKNAGKRSDEYKASEEISEDLSVSYPVDI